MRIFFGFFLTFTAVEARVSFATSQVLDSKDLSGVKTASFRCSAGCRVFSPTSNDNIVITDSAEREYKTLTDLASMKTGDVYDLPGNTYQLTNKGPASPSFLFYAVEKGSANYNTKVLYISGTSSITADTLSDSLITIMSTSGAVHFSNFAGDFSGALPTVYAAGFDAIGGCKPVYSANSAVTVLNTVLPIPSPIATIDFKKIGTGRSVVVTGETKSDRSAGKDMSTVYISSGYVGCKAVGDATYSLAPYIGSIHNEFEATDNDTMTLTAKGDFTIVEYNNPLTLTINFNAQKLFGEGGSISKSMTSNNFRVGFDWNRVSSRDQFAFQIDIATKEAPKTTTKMMQPTQTTTTGKPTTSGDCPTMIFTSIIVMALYFG